VLAQWSTNTAANLIPSALTLVNFAPRYINYKLGVVLAGVIGTLCFPWQILDNLFVFLGYYGAFLSAIGGIMAADYYLIRRRRVNVPDLFSMTGQFRYAGGVNWAGLFAWIVAGGVAAWYSDYAFIIGFPLGLVFYYTLMKALVLPANLQQEITSGYADRFLGTSVGMSWVHLGNGRFERVAIAELGSGCREDL